MSLGLEIAACVVGVKIACFDCSGRSVRRFEMNDRVVLDSLAVPAAHRGVGDAQIWSQQCGGEVDAVYAQIAQRSSAADRAVEHPGRAPRRGSVPAARSPAGS